MTDLDKLRKPGSPEWAVQTLEAWMRLDDNDPTPADELAVRVLLNLASRAEKAREAGLREAMECARGVALREKIHMRTEAFGMEARKRHMDIAVGAEAAADAILSLIGTPAPEASGSDALSRLTRENEELRAEVDYLRSMPEEDRKAENAVREFSELHGRLRASKAENAELRGLVKDDVCELLSDVDDLLDDYIEVQERRLGASLNYGKSVRANIAALLTRLTAALEKDNG